MARIDQADGGVELIEMPPRVLLIKLPEWQLDAASVREVSRLLRKASAHEACRVVVIAAVNDGSSDTVSVEPELDSEQGQTMLRSIWETRQLTISAVNGFVSGQGAALATAADICVVGPLAEFEVSQGLLGSLAQATLSPCSMIEVHRSALAVEVMRGRRSLTASEAIAVKLARPAPEGADFLEGVCAWARGLTATAQGDARQVRRALQLAAARSIPQAL